MRYYTSSTSSASIELLHDHTSAAGQYTVCVKSAAIISPPVSSRDHFIGRLSMVRSIVYEYELVRPVLNSDIFDEEKKQP